MSSTETEHIINLINAVKSHECLWNVNSPDYAKRDKLERAWGEVARRVGHHDTYCREKWRNVRTGFLRSIQNNIRIVADESSNDLMAVRKKRFYLYDQMKFLLPSAEILGEARKRRKLSKIRSQVEDFNDSTSDTLQEYTVIGKYENSYDVDEAIKEHDLDDAANQTDINSAQLLLKNMPEKSPHSNVPVDDQTGNKSAHRSETPTLPPNSSILSSMLRDETIPERYNRRYDSRDVEQLFDFFRGNVDDVLSLSKRNQRTFKRKMLELIEELHNIEDSLV